MTDNFFEERKDQSEIKAKIVEKYFDAWSKVMISALETYSRYDKNKPIAYIDLFSGPGKYEDGSESTPILILKKALVNPKLQQRLLTVFNDKEKRHSDELLKNIKSIPNIDQLQFEPQVTNFEVGDEIANYFQKIKLVPTLMFLDPFGYRGLSIKLISSIMKKDNWGCECIIFFSYDAINRAINNTIVQQYMIDLFTEKKLQKLRNKLDNYNLSSPRKELEIIEHFAEAIKEETDAKYILPFRFKKYNANRTSHHLIFITKNIRGYEIMKEVMARESSEQNQGVGTFEYNPATEKQPLLFQLSRPLDELQDLLLQELESQTLTMQEIYDNHHVDTPYIKSNYKNVLKKLEEQRKITVNPKVGDFYVDKKGNPILNKKGKPKKRRKNSFTEEVIVTFP